METLVTTTKYSGVARKAYQAFFTPQKYEVKPSEREILERGNNYRLPFAGGELAVTSWGTDNAPTVLLMHGWGGSRAQMTGFVNPLTEAGFRVVAYDQPAQGESDGKLTNVLEMAPTMNLIAKQEGNFEALIAHSFGTLISSYALTQLNFSSPAKLIYFGAFNHLLDALPRFQALANLPDAIIVEMRAMIYENFEHGVLEAICNDRMTQKINIPALMFHDAKDNVTPVEDSRAIAQVWKSVRFVETEGLGHRGALQADEIHKQVVEFIKSPI